MSPETIHGLRVLFVGTDEFFQPVAGIQQIVVSGNEGVIEYFLRFDIGIILGVRPIVPAEPDFKPTFLETPNGWRKSLK
jgi:hypothetical protein